MKFFNIDNTERTVTFNQRSLFIKMVLSGVAFAIVYNLLSYLVAVPSFIGTVIAAGLYGRYVLHQIKSLPAANTREESVSNEVSLKPEAASNIR